MVVRKRVVGCKGRGRKLQRPTPLKLRLPRHKRKRISLSRPASARAAVREAMQSASEEVRDDRDIVMQVVSKQGVALECASERLRDDRDVVKEAVRQSWLAYQFASDNLRAERDILMEAVAQNAEALLFATKELKADREVILKALEQNGCALRLAAQELQGDREIVMKAAKQNYNALAHAATALLGDRDFMMDVSLSGFALQYATEEVRVELMDVALAEASAKVYGVGLRVALLSGRRCIQIFGKFLGMDAVLRQCASLLDLDPAQVANSGKLWWGSTEVMTMFDLPAGHVHDVTLVLS